MKLNEKIKELRAVNNMTQEMLADRLGVSSQTVSKWERGLLSPDIALLPKIALLFKCSIDYLFDMDLAWGIEHRHEFEEKIHELNAKKDWDGIYHAFICEIELNPDHYANYSEVMFLVLQKKLFENVRIEKMISLADHAEKCCTDDDIRNEIYRLMLQICSESDDPKVRNKSKYYYEKLPMLRHSREVYAKFVMDREEHHMQMQKNIIYLIDLAECSVRQLILPDMTPEEKLFYYLKAAALYETVLDGKYAGFYDPALFSNYYEIAILYIKLGKIEQARDYVYRILKGLEKHINDDEKNHKSSLLYETAIPNAVPTDHLCKKLLNHMLKVAEFEPFKDDILKMLERYSEYFIRNKEKQK